MPTRPGSSRDLGVRYVLEGSVRTAEHQLRVTGRLLDAETGAVLWSQAYDDDLRVRGFFAIQDDVAQKVATAIGQPYGIIFRADERRDTGRGAGGPGGLCLHAAVLWLSRRAEPSQPCRHPDVP